MNDHPLRRLMQAARGVGTSDVLPRADLAAELGANRSLIEGIESPRAEKGMSLPRAAAMHKLVRRRLETHPDRLAYTRGLLDATLPPDQPPGVEVYRELVGATLVRVASPRVRRIAADVWLTAFVHALRDFRLGAGEYFEPADAETI